MWSPVGFLNFIVKKNLRDDTCDIYVSDFMRIWHVLLPNNELLSISKTLNPLLEASVEKLRDIVFKSLEDSAVKKEIVKESENILIKLESNIMGIKFQFKVLLRLGNEEMLYNELTLPLLRLLLKTHNREKKLINIIKDKDEEIKDYKQEYGVRSDFMSTKPFSKIKLESEEPVADIFWDPSSLLDFISNKLLSTKTIAKVTQQEQLLEKMSNRKRSVNRNVVKNSIFHDKSLNQNKGSQPCLLLDNKIIKKRKKDHEGLKIKF